MQEEKQEEKEDKLSNNPEILSPAGNYECFIAAVENGADAVYVGGKNFSARKNAVNFSDEELLMAVSYAHNRDCKVYVTLNTLVTDDEIPDVFKFINYCYNIGIDALIVQDLSIVSLVREYFPDFPIHASTQMTIYSLDGVRMAKKLGFKRVVLSRELSENEIKYICENTDLEIEVFVHGAICVSYSGQCLLSSMIGQRSGNRGNCAQPCRMPYNLYDKSGVKLTESEKYILSPKDMCLLDKVDRLKKCGVKSFKIEGRMKNKEYVSTVTRLYAKARDGEHISDSDMHDVENIFSRSGFTNAYFNDKKTDKSFLNFDNSNDDVYKKIDKDTLQKARDTIFENTRKIKIDAFVCAKVNDYFTLRVTDGNNEVYVKSDNTLQKALSKPTTADVIKRQLEKLGDTPFELASVNIENDADIFVSLSELNKLRRDAVDKLTNARCKLSREEKNVDLPQLRMCDKPSKTITYRAEVLTLSQAKYLLNKGFEKIFVPYNVVIENLDFFRENKNAFVCVLPVVSRDKYNFDFDKVSFMELSVSNIGQIEKYGKDAYAQHNINAFNSYALDEYKYLGIKSVVLSPELNIDHIKKISADIETEIIVYGRLPVMNMENCVVRAIYNKCNCDNNGYYVLKDRISKDFPVFTNKYNCTNTIYNSAPICMSDKVNELSKLNVNCFRFIFTTETENEIDNILNLYKKGIKPDFDFTRGHFYRGAL